MHKKRRTVRLRVARVDEGVAPVRRRDTLVVEEPLTIIWQAEDGPSERLAATMRTPGDDNELAAGLLFSEGLLRHRGEVNVLSFCVSGAPNELNRLRAQLRIPRAEADRRLGHRPSSTLPQSACGLCSFDELASPRALLDWASSARPEGVVARQPTPELLGQALAHLDRAAPLFAATGASHATVLVGPDGALLGAAEDVGRHNACDKAIGRMLLECRSDTPSFQLPAGTGMLVSSRLSFEIAAKAVRAGVAWMASVGAPTHLAVELATAVGTPLIGFLSGRRRNEYVSL